MPSSGREGAALACTDVGRVVRWLVKLPTLCALPVCQATSFEDKQRLSHVSRRGDYTLLQYNVEKCSTHLAASSLESVSSDRVRHLLLFSSLASSSSSDISVQRLRNVKFTHKVISWTPLKSK